jgi:hypothetical protein
MGLLLLVTTPVAPAGAADSRGAATQDGWWNRVQGPAEGEPDGNALRPLVPAIPQPPNVPADAIAAGGGGGQVDKVAAVGIDVALADGARVEQLTLRLKEATGGGANVGAERARVLACPAAKPWEPSQNGPWRDRPTADCGVGSAQGVRSADGTWAFDLTAVGRLWGDPFAPLAANGVVLSVDPASPTPVQVSWFNVGSGQIAVELTATPGAPLPEDRGDPAAPQPLAAAPPTPPSGGPYLDSAADTRAFPAESGGVASDPLAFASGRPAFAPSGGDAAEPAEPAEPVVPVGPPEEAALPAPAADTPARGEGAAVGFWERVPTPTALLVPVTIGLAVLIGVVLGPGGRPSPDFAREGGLSRALARRSPSGEDGARPSVAVR